jgi:hypothetical protein
MKLFQIGCVFIVGGTLKYIFALQQKIHDLEMDLLYTDEHYDRRIKELLDELQKSKNSVSTV